MRGGSCLSWTTCPHDDNKRCLWGHFAIVKSISSSAATDFCSRVIEHLNSPLTLSLSLPHGYRQAIWFKLDPRACIYFLLLSPISHPPTALRICFIFCTGYDSPMFDVLIIQCQWYIGRKRRGLCKIWHSEETITYHCHSWLTAAPSKKKKECSLSGEQVWFVLCDSQHRVCWLGFYGV